MTTTPAAPHTAVHDAAGPAPRPVRPAHTGAHDEAAATVITGARERIDDLDARIIGLIEDRMAVSAEIQRARIGSGGRRVNLSREMEVIGHYADRLGRHGTSLAMTLLELSRGATDAA